MAGEARPHRARQRVQRTHLGPQSKTSQRGQEVGMEDSMGESGWGCCDLQAGFSLTVGGEWAEQREKGWETQDGESGRKAERPSPADGVLELAADTPLG